MQKQTPTISPYEKAKETVYPPKDAKHPAYYNGLYGVVAPADATAASASDATVESTAAVDAAIAAESTAALVQRG